jgi:hypothetical protein
MRVWRLSGHCLAQRPRRAVTRSQATPQTPSRVRSERPSRQDTARALSHGHGRSPVDSRHGGAGGAGDRGFLQGMARFPLARHFLLPRHVCPLLARHPLLPPQAVQPHQLHVIHPIRSHFIHW